jgi:hypothetical protein
MKGQRKTAAADEARLRKRGNRKTQVDEREIKKSEKFQENERKQREM